MDIELIEIRDFLAGQAPFSELPSDTLDDLPKKLEVRYFRRGKTIFGLGETNTCLYLVRSGAVDLYGRDESLVSRLGEGDGFGYPSLLSGRPTQNRAEAIEDTLVYTLPQAEFDALRRAHKVFDQFYSEAYAERVRHALGNMREVEGEVAFMTAEAGELVARAPITTSPDTSIRAAAERMRDERVSSLLITHDDALVGIVTDRDLRNRVVAAGASYDAPVSSIMTENPITLAAKAFVFEVLLTMTHHNLHHVPIVADDKLVGLLTTTDLMRQQSANPVYLVGDLRKQQTVEGVAGVAERLPQVLRSLIDADATAYDIGRIVTLIGDAINQRLLRLAEQQLGPPPVPYAWLVFGSQARGEQSLHSDQDNALLLSNDADLGAHSDYFDSLARFVSDGLNACGYRYCDGNVMGTNPKWRQPLKVWQGYFDDWIVRPKPEALLNASIFFDMRSIYGDDGLFEQLHSRVMRQSAENQIFVAQMAKNALDNQPPLGFFRQFVLDRGGDHGNTFDLKHRGVVPIIDLARVYALAEGAAAVNTQDRLEAVSESGSLSRDGAANLRDALEFIAFARLRHQARQLKKGEQPNNHVSPDEMSPLERRYLKDAFKIVDSMQSALTQRYQVGRLG
ncbi:MAG: putative nucleotidyltransferase substrate binding domain-containing protein [Trueperaceae bacterium]|nr:putative nucleotidyltransferase substrate binding domain-containing protein [Trueperaceae bacterium]